MTYAQAVEELKEMAGNRDWSLIHETTRNKGVEIHCYISGLRPYGHSNGGVTYQHAVGNMKGQLANQGDPAPEDKEV